MPVATAHQPWLNSYPGHMPIPTMLARSEIEYLHWLAATQYSGRGRIVDLGCFFGGSTMPLAAGLAANSTAATAPNILTYDSFIMDADTAPRFPVGLGDGDSFRPIFETYLRGHLARITTREGWLPTQFNPADARRLYPEQEPIEILFIDLAKLWPVHDTILRLFGPHLIPGHSIIIQQDFKHHGTYWLGLHMLQLRDCFEPLHDITGGASVAFRYNAGGGIETELQALLTRDDIPPHAIAQSWRDVDSYWSAKGHTAIRLIQRLAAATHLADAGRIPEALDFLTLFSDEFRNVTSDPDAALLRSEFASACRRFEAQPGGAAAAILRANFDQPAPHAWRDSRRQAAIDRLRAAGHTTIALYGAGRHTAELLASGWPHGKLTIAAILDDFSTAPDIRGIPILRPASIPDSATAILISSEASEDGLSHAASATHPTRPIFRIYS